MAAETISVALSFYLITFLQRMLEMRGRLGQAEEALDDIFHNRRVNASMAPAVIGLLPSAGALLISGAIVKNSCGDYMSDEDMTFTTSFFRHIPESFLPTYASILLAITLSGVSTAGLCFSCFPWWRRCLGWGICSCCASCRLRISVRAVSPGGRHGGGLQGVSGQLLLSCS